MITLTLIFAAICVLFIGACAVAGVLLFLYFIIMVLFSMWDDAHSQ